MPTFCCCYIVTTATNIISSTTYYYYNNNRCNIHTITVLVLKQSTNISLQKQEKAIENTKQHRQNVVNIDATSILPCLFCVTTTTIAINTITTSTN